MRTIAFLLTALAVTACSGDDGGNNGDPDARIGNQTDAATNMADAATIDALTLDAAPLPTDACVNSDNDTHCDIADNCPLVDNEGQEDTHGAKVRSIPFAIEALTGTDITNCAVENITLPFAVSVLDQTYTVVDVNGDGLVTFESISSLSQLIGGTPFVCTNNFDNQILPAIAVSWTDNLLPSVCKGQGVVRHEVRGAAPNRRLVVSWDGVQQDQGLLTAQLIIYEADSRIEIHTQNQPMGTATRGAQYALPLPTDGRRSHLPGQNGALFAITNESIEITTDPEPDGVGDACDNTTDETAANDCGFGY